MKRSPLGVYVHWPFCQAKCPYCDFNSHVTGKVDPESWAKAFDAELRRYAKETPEHIVKTVFFGGGTPSLMPASLVSSFLDSIRSAWSMTESPEVTLEANPTSVEAARFRDYHAAGVNRVSVGIQALSNHDLKLLGRLHSVTEALAALEVARSVFDRVSFDLIYARQNQSLSDWQAELTRALSFQTDHLSLYQLTIEPETVFGKRYARGHLKGLPKDDLAADMFELTQSMCESAGLPAYEVSNHAKPGQESRHNMIYWEGGDFVGVGPGAHGRITLDGRRFATETPLAPTKWLKEALGGSAESARFELDREEVFHERLLMGLRLKDGIPLDILSDALDLTNSNKIKDLIDDGFLHRSNSHLSTTLKGRMVLNTLLAEILV